MENYDNTLVSYEIVWNYVLLNIERRLSALTFPHTNSCTYLVQCFFFHGIRIFSFLITEKVKYVKYSCTAAFFSGKQINQKIFSFKC